MLFAEKHGVAKLGQRDLDERLVALHEDGGETRPKRFLRGTVDPRQVETLLFAEVGDLAHDLVQLLHVLVLAGEP